MENAMHIIMVDTRRGSEDGIAVQRYMKGEKYEVAQSMGAMFIANGWAKSIRETSITDDMANFKDRLDYQKYLGTAQFPDSLLEFEDWKTLRDVANNN